MHNYNYLNSINPKDYFEAYLKDENDQLLEIGKGHVSLEKQSVDFVSDFVPLLKFKSTAKIIKLIDGEECHCFVGEVYLSSKNRLQLLDVCDSFITYKELHISQKVHITGFVTSASKESLSEDPINIEIFSISMDEVCFTVPKEYSISARLLLQTNDPMRTSGIILSVYKQLQFSIEKTVCYAVVERCPAGCKKTLIDFLAPNLILFP